MASHREQKSTDLPEHQATLWSIHTWRPPKACLGYLGIKLMRRITQIIAFLFSVATLSAAESRKPNILFIFCDDLGYGDLGVFHQNSRAALKDRNVPYFTTPEIDKVAEAGIQFKQHYCAAPVCAPSRASLLTGVHQGQAGIRDNQFDRELPDTKTLASILKEANYATAAFGKWGLQGPARDAEDKKAVHGPGAKFPGWTSMPTDRGFDYYLGYVRHRDGHLHYPVEDKKQVWENKTEISSGMELSFTTDLFTAAAKRWIVQQNKKSPDQPFFVFLAHDTPHAKLQNPPCAYPEGGGLNGGVQWIGKPGQMLNTSKGKYDAWMHPDYADATWDHDKDPSTAEEPWPEVQKRYANNVRRIDDTVGDLMQLLEDLNIAENTLVVFSSDNGPSQESYIQKHPYHPTFFHGFGPFDGIKRDTLEGGLRVPTIARWPAKTKAGSVADEPSGHWDWLATFADAAGLPQPASSDGVSLVPTLTGKGDQAPSIIYSEYAVGGKTPNYPSFAPSHKGKVRGQMQVVFVDGYKGIRTGIKSQADDFEIYDVDQDPKEIRNLAKAKGFDEIQAKMKKRVLQIRKPLESAARPYDGELIPPTDQKLHLQGAFFTMIEGKAPWIPNIRESMSFASAKNYFTIPSEQITGEPFTLKWSAAVKIPADGVYQFSLETNSQAMLYLHDIRVIDENSEPVDQPRVGTAPLKAGWHPVDLLFKTDLKNPTLSFKITDANGDEIPLNADNLKTLNPGW